MLIKIGEEWFDPAEVANIYIASEKLYVRFKTCIEKCFSVNGCTGKDLDQVAQRINGALHVPRDRF
jgi:hypothetical protein